MRKGYGSGVSKKAGKQLKKARKKAPSRQFGKPIMKDDPRKSGRKMGYADAGTGMKAKYKYKKKKATSTASKRSTRKKMY